MGTAPIDMIAASPLTRPRKYQPAHQKTAQATAADTLNAKKQPGEFEPPGEACPSSAQNRLPQLLHRIASHQSGSDGADSSALRNYLECTSTCGTMLRCGMHLKYQFSEKDSLALRCFAEPIRYRLLSILASVLAALPSAMVSAYRGFWDGMAIFGIFFVSELYFLGRYALRALRTAPPRPSDVEVGETIVLTHERLQWHSGLDEGRWSWACVDGIVRFQNWLFLPMATGAWVVPRSEFAEPTDFEVFARDVQSRIQSAPAERESARVAPLRAGPFSADEVQFDITFRNSPADLHAAGLYPEVTKARLHGKLGCALFAVGTCLQFMYASWPPIFLGQAIASFGLVLPLQAVHRWLNLQRDTSTFLFELPRRLQVSRDRLALTTALFEITASWDMIQQVTHDAERVCLFELPPLREAVIIPRSAFSSESESDRFVDFVDECRIAALQRKGQPIPVETGNPYQTPGA